MKLKINRCRVDPGDNLTDLTLNSEVCSTFEATNKLILEGCAPEVKRFSFYHWSLSGIFRNGTGTFKWYFQLKGDSERYARTITCYFEEEIDFEHDETDEIFRKLEDRLIKIWDALYKYNGEKESNMLLAFEPIIEGKL